MVRSDRPVEVYTDTKALYQRSFDYIHHCKSCSLQGTIDSEIVQPL